MTLRIYAFVLILSAGLMNTLQAQENIARITGYVYDPGNKASAYSTVILLNQDSVFMKGTLSQTDGLFLLEQLNPGNYFLMIRNVEFETYISELLSVERGQYLSLDTIRLQTRINDIGEVVVTGTKAMVEVHADKMVFNVSSSVNASGNNGLELIGKAPGVLVDMDKNIVLQGKSGVQIYINGRPSRLSGSDLTNMLESLRSDNIESLEIISNPSAKYEAEGTGGIINIVLKKNTRAGFNGNVTSGYSKGRFVRQNVGTSLNYSGNKISLYSSLNLSDDQFQDDIYSDMIRTGYTIVMDSRGINSRKGLNISGGADYSINAQNMISLDARAIVNDRGGDLKSSTLITDLSGINSPEMLNAKTLDDSNNDNYSLNLHYSFIPDKNTSLTAGLSTGSFSSKSDTYQPNEYITADSGIFLRSVASRYNTATDIGLMSALLDFEKKSGPVTYSAGAKYSYVSTGNNLDFYNLLNELPVRDSLRSNDFSYLEKIAAVYFITNVIIGENLKLNAGLRLENTSSLGELQSETENNNSIVPRNYSSLFPSAGISYDDKKNHSIAVSIGRRITRPNYQDLNPFEYKTSELSAWRGNPFLRPNYIMNYQVTYSFRQKLVISNNYSVTRDFFANVFITVDEKSRIITPRNLQKVINNGLSVSYPLKVAKWWQFSSFFIYNHVEYNGQAETSVIDLKADVYNFRMQNTFKLPGDITMELTYNYNSPSIWAGTVNVRAFQSLNAGIKKSFFKERLLLQLTGNDMFNTGSAFHWYSNYGGMDQTGIRAFDSSRYGVNLTYKFGNQQAKGVRKKSSGIDDELRRISD